MILVKKLAIASKFASFRKICGRYYIMADRFSTLVLIFGNKSMLIRLIAGT